MELKNDYVLGFIICEIFTVITLQEWVGWGIFTVIPGYPRRANGDLSGVAAGDFAICGRFGGPNSAIAACGLRFGELKTPPIQGRVGLAILKSRRVEARCDLSLRPYAKNVVPAGESLSISGAGWRCG